MNSFFKNPSFDISYCLGEVQNKPDSPCGCCLYSYFFAELFSGQKVARQWR